MARSLYLDTARLGPMSPTALRLHTEFVRLAAEEPCSLYCEDFLKYGIDAVPELCERFPQLNLWHGTAELKSRISEALGRESPEQSHVLLTSRTSALMQLSANLLSNRCRRILVPDVIWPPYLRALRKASAQSGSHVVAVPVRSRLFSGEFSRSQLLDYLLDRFQRQKCDGLFLPLVDHCGARLPAEALLDHLQRTKRLRCSVVDASQAFGHIDTRATTARADFVFGGGHKWLGSYLPLGIGLAANADTAAELREQMVESGCDDPLLRMLESSTSSLVRDPRETVNMTPLLTCRGVLEDTRWQDGTGQAANRKFTEALLRQHGWQMLLPQPVFQSGIVLARAEHKSVRRMNPVAARRKFRDAGLSVTTYAGGFVRGSMPFQRFTPEEFDILDRGSAAMSTKSSITRTASQLGVAFAAPRLGSDPAPPPCAVDLRIAECSVSAAARAHTVRREFD